MSLWGLAPWEAKTTVVIYCDPVVSRGDRKCKDIGWERNSYQDNAAFG